MGRIVYGSFNSVTIAADATQDLWSLVAAANKRLKLHAWEISSADIAAEICALSLKRITGHGTGGTAVTEQEADEDHGTLTASMQYGVVTTQGTADGVLQGFQWEQLGPLGQIYTPEMRPVSLPGNGFALTLDSAVGFTASGWVCWEEL